MLNKEIKKHTSNPAVGLLPFILFVALHAMNIPNNYALFAGIGSAVIGEFLFSRYCKAKKFCVTFYISAIALGLTLGIWFLTHEHMHDINSYIIICEVIIVTFLIILHASKTYIETQFLKKQSPLHKVLMSEYCGSASLVRGGLTIHIFAVLLYREFMAGHSSIQALDILMFSILPILTICLVGTYQTIRENDLISKLMKEEWLPIVSEKGEVTGKIAKSVTLGMKNKFLHPIVRVALIANSKIYLQERSLNNILNPGKLDSPFEKYMLFNNDINFSARNSIKRMMGNNVELSVKFLLKYVFENDYTRRLVFLFVAHIDDENEIKREGKMDGKFWTIKQIEEGFSDGIFGECFELEFEYLKNIVIPATNAFRVAN